MPNAPREPASAGTNPHSELRQAQVDEAIAFWEPLAGRRIGGEEGRQIIDNMTIFFKILIEWDAADRARGQEASRDRRPADLDAAA
jgi:hypothetical protein